MATYRFSAKVVKRSAGRSATASAAYRAGELIHDERTGQTFDYTRRGGVLHQEIITPANTPDWMTDRAKLWNAVEVAEKRKDAQLAREIQLSLPHELTQDQRVGLVREFVRVEFVGQGMIADITLHAPDKKGDDRNHHAHVMLTMREIAGGGFGKKARDWNDTEQLETWRSHWGDAVNRALEQCGHEARVDHRSYEDQGIDREPEPKLGPVATQMEREGRPSHAGDDLRAVQERNRSREGLEETLAGIKAEIIALEPAPAVEEPELDDQETARVHPATSSSSGGMVAQQQLANRMLARHYRDEDAKADPSPGTDGPPPRGTAATGGNSAATADNAPAKLEAVSLRPLDDSGARRDAAANENVRAGDPASPPSPQPAKTQIGDRDRLARAMELAKNVERARMERGGEGGRGIAAGKEENSYDKSNEIER